MKWSLSKFYFPTVFCFEFDNVIGNFTQFIKKKDADIALWKNNFKLCEKDLNIATGFIIRLQEKIKKLEDKEKKDGEFITLIRKRWRMF